MTTRRGFLGAILAAAAAPAIITTPGILMPVRKIIAPESSPDFRDDIIEGDFGEAGFIVLAHPSILEDLKSLPEFSAPMPGFVGAYQGIRVIESPRIRGRMENTAVGMELMHRQAEKKMSAMIRRMFG